MKSILFIFLLFIATSCHQTRNVAEDSISEIVELYTITKVKNEKSFYVIYAERNDSTFKIVSAMENEDSPNCIKIRVKNKYHLELRKIFPLDSLMGYAIAPNLGIVFSYGEEDKIVHVEEKSHFAIYGADNIRGLCLIEKEMKTKLSWLPD